MAPTSEHPVALPSACRIVAFSSIAGAMTVFGQTAGISVFIDSLIADLSVSRAEISTVYSASSLVAAFAMPWVGRQIDQHGSRRAALAVSAVFGARGHRHVPGRGADRAGRGLPRPSPAGTGRVEPDRQGGRRASVPDQPGSRRRNLRGGHGDGTVVAADRHERRDRAHRMARDVGRQRRRRVAGGHPADAVGPATTIRYRDEGRRPSCRRRARRRLDPRPRRADGDVLGDHPDRRHQRPGVHRPGVPPDLDPRRGRVVADARGRELPAPDRGLRDRP